MSITDKDLARINELYKKQKSEGLTPEEKEEQAVLRGNYIAAFRQNLRGQLENISIKNPDGSIVAVKDRRKPNKKLPS